MNLLDRAIQIAVEAHKGVLDKGGKPYILHPLWVMDRVRHLGQDAMIVGVLHDVVEDTPWTLRGLKEEGFNVIVMNALSYLTHDKEIPYQEYIEKLSGNDLARQVKLRDLEHNSKITRLRGVSDKDTERMKKYHKAFQFLNY